VYILTLMPLVIVMVIIDRSFKLPSMFVIESGNPLCPLLKSVKIISLSLISFCVGAVVCSRFFQMYGAKLQGITQAGE
jgi:hypothetical protein